MSWAMATGAGLGGASKTGYSDSNTNNAIGSAVPGGMQKFIQDPMKAVSASLRAGRDNRQQNAGIAPQEDGSCNCNK